MNKLVVVLALLAACAFAGEKYTPKKFDCAFHAKIILSIKEGGQTMSVNGDMWGLQKDKDIYFRMDGNMGSMNISTITRCDQKNGTNCLSVVHGVGGCDEQWVDDANEYDEPFYYDKKTTVDCPSPIKGKCTRYYNSTEETALYVDSDDNMVKAEGGDMDIVFEWKDDVVSADLFAVERCDQTKLAAPVNPCAASITKAAFMVVLAALLLALL